VISHEIIEEIKYRNDIADVISGYVTLKRAGSNFQGLCPFHSEKTPSFVVFPSGRNFYCFGCGAGGDVISFVMRAENLSYREALEFLAKRAGITIPVDASKSESGVKRRRILDMNRSAAKFFHKELLSSKDALAYLNKRGLSMPLIKHFGLGYAPEGFGKLTNHLVSEGYTKEEMVSGFLCGVSKKTGRPYDYFRGRVMFPIIDVSGEVIAFGGRIIGDGEPKYLNTSDTPAFKKSRNLYALNYAKNSCADRLILCEGYMDVIALHGAGFTNAVATLGTAITPDQARLMKKYTKSVVISYDSDQAGQRAAGKAFALLGEVGVETRILKMEGAKDPDEYVKKYGATAFSKLLDGSRSQFDYVYEIITSKYDMSTTDGKVAAASEIAGEISKVYSLVEQDIYIKRVCSELDFPYDAMRSDVNRRRKKRDEAEKREERRKMILETEGYGDRVNPDAIKNIRASNAEEALLGVLMLYPELMRDFRKSDCFLSPDDFATSFGRRVYEKILSAEDGKFDIGFLAEEFTQEEMGRVSAMLAARNNLTKNDMSVVSEYANIILEEKRKNVGIEELILNKRAKNKRRDI